MTRVDIEEQIQADDGGKVSSHKMAPKSSRVLFGQANDKMIIGRM